MLAAQTERPVQLIEAGQGSPLVLLHGGGSMWSEWASLLPHLQQGFRCLAVDRPGHGLSHRIDYRKVPDFRAEAAAFVERTLDLLDLERATLVGNSMGGFFALAFALAHPERVERLILPGAPAGIDRRVPLPIRLLGVPLVGKLLWSTVMRPSERGLRRLFERLLVADASRVTDEEVACLVASHEQPGASLAWLTLLQRFRTLRGVSSRCYLRDELAGLEVPTHFLWGENDAYSSPTSGQELSQRMPNASLEVIPGAGHLPWIDAPERCAAAIRKIVGIRHAVSD